MSNRGWMQREKHVSKQVLEWVCQKVCVSLCVCGWVSLDSVFLVITTICMITHPLVKEASVSPLNCLCCVGCCHCWRINWTLISVAFSVIRAWATAFWAAVSLSPPVLSQGPTHPCWHRRSICAKHRPFWCQDGFRCHYLTWACQHCCGQSHFCPCQHLPQQAARSSAEAQTEVELERERGILFSNLSN